MDSVEDRYGDAARAKSVLILLEEAANYVEAYFPSRLSGKDALTDDWFKDSMRQVAIISICY
jgi:hypothetical protein